MANRNGNKNGKNKKPKKKPAPAVKAGKRSNGSRMEGLDQHARSYIKLLSDPCGADLVPSLYEGAGAAYQIRLTGLAIPVLTGTGFTPGLHYKMDVVVGFIPGSRIIGMYTANGGAIFGAPSVQTVFPFLDTTTVQSYRCVAACMKFQPNGEYSQRSGTIGTYPETNLSTPPGGGFTALTSFTKAIDIVSIGSELHEVVWVPTAVDGNMRTGSGPFSDAAVTGGVIALVMTNVDGVATSATSVAVQGLINLTAAYEWTPETVTGGTGIPSNISSVPRTPLNTALSVLGNLSKWATAGYRAYQHPVAQAGFSLLSNGMTTRMGTNMRNMRISM